jgi:Na+-driven multidrug efflux pump
MWLGLIAGLTVAALLMGARFLRSSRNPRIVGTSG